MAKNYEFRITIHNTKSDLCGFQWDRYLHSACHYIVYFITLVKFMLAVCDRAT